MEKPTNLQLLCFLCFIAVTSTEAIGYDSNGATKLYVFGDSYADTGNTRPSTACWREPYGMTYPGRPDGRFSDGHVFSDHIAQYLGVESPIPYNKNKTSTRLDNGVNFAFGGTGVFDTQIDEPNMTTQIDFFQQLLGQQTQTGFNLNSSIALLSTSGNDYLAFVQKNIGNILKLKSFSQTVVKQLATNILRLKGLGVKKIAVTGMGPIGCYPAFSFLTLYTKCSDIFNSISKYHNTLLNETVQQMGSNINVVFMDMYTAFNNAFNTHNITSMPHFFIIRTGACGNLQQLSDEDVLSADYVGNMKFEQLLKPCCDGNLITDECGSTDDSGAKKYKLCSNPQETFFWDKEHPTQFGWNSVFDALKPSLGNLVN